MKEIIVSNCEKSFIQKAITEGTRLDGRNLDKWRTLKICLGSEWGSCHVSLGSTKVVSHVTCKVGQPKQTRPNEGILFVNVELGTMGAPNFEPNRQSDLSVYLNRLIEKCILESRCLDLESLCIVSEEKVWTLRIDIHVLNHAGNIIECASIAALTSLAHFKRPDFTTNGDDLIIHTMAEKDPLPMTLHHYPVCVSFGVFGDGTMVADPNLTEETVCNNLGAILVIGMNPYREVCLLDLTGAAVTSGPNLIYKATQKATGRVKYIVTEIKRILSEDEQLRASGAKIGFANAISGNELMTLTVDKLFLRLDKFDINMSENVENDKHITKLDVEMHSDGDESADEEVVTKVTDVNMAALIPKSRNASKPVKSWAQMASDEESGGDQDDDKPDDDDKQEDDVQIVKVITAEDRIVAKIHVSSDSEEEDVVMLEPEIIKNSAPSKKKTSKKQKNKTKI